MNDVRKPPVGAVLRLHKQGERGLCGWCGGRVEERTPARGLLLYWHSRCASEMAIIEQPEAARRAVFARDKGVCIDCGEDWSERSRFVPTNYVPASDIRNFDIVADEVFYTCGPKRGTLVHIHQETFDWNVPSKRREAFPAVMLTAISMWHVDHRQPLWKARFLPDLQRLEFFKLDNLVTRCEACHKRKTKRESAERAHFNALARNAVGPKLKRKIPSRPMGPGRGFPPKGSRPMRKKT